MKLLLCSAVAIVLLASVQAYVYYPLPDYDEPLVRIVRSAEPQYHGGYRPGHGGGYRPGHGGGYRPGYGGGGYRPGGGAGFGGSASNANAASQSFSGGGFGGGFSGSASQASSSSQSFGGGGFHG